MLGGDPKTLGDGTREPWALWTGHPQPLATGWAMGPENPSGRFPKTGRYINTGLLEDSWPRVINWQTPHIEIHKSGGFEVPRRTPLTRRYRHTPALEARYPVGLRDQEVLVTRSFFLLEGLCDQDAWNAEQNFAVSLWKLCCTPGAHEALRVDVALLLKAGQRPRERLLGILPDYPVCNTVTQGRWRG